MKQGFFATIFYIPLYNALIFLVSVMPGKSAGLAVVALTILIRIVLYPLSKKSIRTQLQMKRIEPDVQRIKEKVSDKQEQARQMMDLYKKNGINPFAGFLLLLIQLPILIALYQVFQSGLPSVNADLLYGFVRMPESVSMSFLGIDLLRKSIPLAILAVVTQFIQINISLPKSVKKKDNASFQSDLAHSMNVQMRYIFPLVLFPIAYVSSVLAIYLTTSNVLMTLQELFVRRRMIKQYGLEEKK